MGKEISTGAGVEIITQQGATLLASLVPAVLSLPPAWQAAFLTGSALIQTWGAWGQSRVNEIVEELKKHDGKFDEKVLQSDEFKTVLLNVIEVHMKEAAVEKRRLYRNYMINVAMGLPMKIDYHSKLFAILNLITFDEIHTLEQIVGVFDQTNFPEQLPSSERHVLTSENIFRSLGNTSPSPEQVQQLGQNMRALQSYNLIFTGDARETTTGAVTPSLQVVTEFGREFLKFISEHTEAARG